MRHLVVDRQDSDVEPLIYDFVSSGVGYCEEEASVASDGTDVFDGRHVGDL